MLTTVVGSYPANPQPPSSMGQKLFSFFGSYDPYQVALEKSVEDQVKAGINLISDGQVRGDMIEIFAQALPGMVYEEGVSKIVGKINSSSISIGSNDLKKALKIAINLSADFKEDAEILKDNEFSKKAFGVKGIITGPTTMTLSSRIEGFYRQDRKDKAVLDLAVALKKEAEELQKAGAALIQIDEPFLSTGIADLNTAKKAISLVRQDLEIPLAIHVCGDITEVFSDILKFPVDVIDLEFAGNNTNLPAIEDKNLHGKKIGFGCI
ncbi:MAG TPA: methionine synthase, partial [Methanobacteriaceae archaeon]|nr:methionine synthase [Methanobacteriaceae archaeon]